MKKFLIIILILLAIPLLLIHFFLDKILQDKLEILLDNVPNMSIAVGSISTSFFPPSIVINDVSVKNGGNDIWREAVISRIRINPNLQSVTTDKIIIDSVTVVEPQILCDVNKIDIGTIIEQNIPSGKSGKPGFGGIFQGIKEIIKGTTRLGTSIVKTIINPKTILQKPKPNVTLEEKTKVNKLKFIIKNVYIKEGVFIPTSNILWIKAGDKVKLPDINLVNIGQNSSNDIIKNVQEVVSATVKATLTEMKNKH